MKLCSATHVVQHLVRVPGHSGEEKAIADALHLWFNQEVRSWAMTKRVHDFKLGDRALGSFARIWLDK